MSYAELHAEQLILRQQLLKAESVCEKFVIQAAAEYLHGSRPQMLQVEMLPCYVLWPTIRSAGWRVPS